MASFCFIRATNIKNWSRIVKKIKKSITYWFILTISIGMLLVSCNISSVIDGYPTPTISPTPRICPTDVQFLSGDDLKVTPTLFIVIFDKSDAINSIGFEYKDKTRTVDTFEFINKLIPEISGPGDQYSLFQFGYYDYKYARLGGYESRLVNSPLLNFETPTPYLTATPYSTPDYSEMEDIERMAEQNEYKNQVEDQNSEVEQALFEEQCYMTIVKSSIDATATAWSVTKSAEVTEIAAQLIGDQPNTAQPTPVVTQFPYDEVYFGLRHVSTDFNYLCEKYEKCILLIFDDLIDWRNPSKSNLIPEDIDYRLDNVNVIAVISDCAPIQDPECQERIERWDSKLKSLGAVSTKYFDGSRLEERLSDYIFELKNK